MSQLNKKGKNLTTKRKNNRRDNREKRNMQDSGNNTALFDSFVTTRTSKPPKDLSLGVSQKSSAQEHEEDFFKFPDNTSGFSGQDKIFSDTTITPQSTTVEEGDKIKLPIIDSLSKSESPEKLNDSSSLFFKSTFKSEIKTKSDGICKTSKEDSTKDSSFDDCVPIPNVDDLQKLKPDTVANENLPGETEESESDASNQCPVCLKTFVAAKYLSHMKSCAAKNNLTTQQLLSALRLHKKQLAERKELGLGIPVQSYRARVSPKRSRANERKGATDSSLQLALALSASLQAAQEEEVIQEAEVLKEAGLSAEAEQRLSTLEKYGFASALPAQPRSAPGGARSRPLPPSLLLRRTQEERERIVTEKVAIVLINEDESGNITSFTPKQLILKSKFLLKNWDSESQLWKKAHCPEDESRDAFYVKSLSQFVTPSQGQVGEGLRRLSQLPGRMNTPMKESNSESPMSCNSLLDIPTPNKPKDSNSFCQLGETDISDLPTPLRSGFGTSGRRCESFQNNENIHGFSTLSSLSEDWKKLVNNEVLSDILINCRDSVVIPAHKLVFHVRCPRILNEVEFQGSTKGVLNWKNLCVNSVLAFLEFVYCGLTDKILMLDENRLIALNAIAERLDYAELKGYLSKTKESCNGTRKSDVKKSLFRSDETTSTKRVSAESSDLNNEKLTGDSTLTDSAIGKICEILPSSLNQVNLCDDRRSPDMFGEASIISDIESQEERQDLDVLVSLIAKPTQYLDDLNKSNPLAKRGYDSLAVSTSTEKLHRKRKASNTSLSGDEDTSLSKKRCSDVSKNNLLEIQSMEEAFDLTQSSNSSNAETLEKVSSEKKSLETSHKGSPKRPSSETNFECDAFDLTQSSKSSDKGNIESSKDRDKINSNLNEADSDDSTIDLTQKMFSDEPIPDNFEIQSKKNESGIKTSQNVMTPDKLQVTANVLQSMDNFTLSTPNISVSKSNPDRYSSKFSDSDKKLLADHSCISRKGCDDSLFKDNNVQDYIDPVWDGFDDYYHFNCPNDTSSKTPKKYEHDKTLNISVPSSSNIEQLKSRTSVSPVCKKRQKTPKKLSETSLSPLNMSSESIKSISSDSKSPKLTYQKCLTQSSASSIKYVSSDSTSPKLLSQKSLHDDSPILKVSSKQRHHDLSKNESEILKQDLEMSIGSVGGSIKKHTSHQNIIKTRKNLSFEFEANSDISKGTCQETRKENLPDTIVSHYSENSQNNRHNTSPRKDSLAAMQRLLDDSFEVNESLFDVADAVAIENEGTKGEDNGRKSKSPSKQDRFEKSRSTLEANCSGQVNVMAGNSKNEGRTSGQDEALVETCSSKNSQDTPSPSIIVSDKVTPLPDYSGMKTPTLKKELSRFGLKPSLGRRKAKLLLRYIYDQTHPIVPDSSGEFRQPTGPAPRSPVKSPRKQQSSVNVGSPTTKQVSAASSKETLTTVKLDDSESESDDPCSQMSTSSSFSSSASLPEESFHEADDILTQDLSDSGDVRSSIRSLITGDQALHRKVLMYEPIYLEDLMARLKARGVKTKANMVMDYLDEQCITFRTNSWKATNEKRRLKQKSPKKKAKQPSPAKSNVSPLKVQTQVTKKRGRPKKTVKNITVMN